MGDGERSDRIKAVDGSGEGKRRHVGMVLRRREERDSMLYYCQERRHGYGNDEIELIRVLVLYQVDD